MKTPILVSESGILFPGQRGGKYFRGRDLGVFIPIFFSSQGWFAFSFVSIIKVAF